MGLSRLQNFIKNVKGNILYVDPNNLDATDNVENKGNSPVRPFVTLQRALIEAARFSYQRGFDNDRFERTTIMLSPGVHTIDNRPGLIPDWTAGSDPSYIQRNGSRTDDFPPFDLTTNFNIESANNILYKFNSIRGGVFVPRGISIVGTDLRKTKIRPLYVPNPQNDNIERSAIFRVTGGSHYWGFTILDADPNGYCYKDYTSNTFLPNFSHHKLTAFEYADGVNAISIDDDFQTYSTTRTDLDLYYEKVGLAYGIPSGRTISPDYPSNVIDIQAKVDEYRIVGSTGQEVGITSIKSGDGLLSTNIITVDVNEEIEGLQVDTPIQISGVTVSGYNGQFVLSEVVSPTQFKYKVQNAPLNPLPTGIQIVSATLNIVSDTVTSASPYIFNVSLRSVFGMCGLHADGNTATGFKSMVVAQFTGIGLQKDDNAFVLYNEQTGTYEDNTVVTNLSSNSRARFKPSYENYHIKASNNAFIQLVSIFAIGYAEHFKAETGGDLSITNSNSNFGAKSLVSSGYRDLAFTRDDVGYITHIIPPQEIESDTISIEYGALDVGLTTSVGISSHLYLLDETNEDVTPSYVIEGYRIGAKENEDLNLRYNQVNYSSTIVMQGSSQTSSKKSYTVDKKVDGISNEINSSVITLSSTHDLANGESVRVLSDNGQLPDGLLPNSIYYVITNDIDPGLSSNEIKLAKSLNDALSGNLSGSELTIYSNESSTLTIESRVSDKLPGELGHPIQWDSANENWYIHTTSSNDLYDLISTTLSTASLSATSRTYITRRPDSRSSIDTIYRLRYVIPKDSTIDARSPLDGFVVQDAGSNSLISSEIQKYFNINSTTLTNSNELRNPRFISGASWSSNIATITTELPHNLAVGSQVRIDNIISSNNLTGAYNSGYNGTFIILSIPSRKEFTVAISVNPGIFDITQTINRDTSLPQFRRVKFNGTYTSYRVQEVQSYISGEQDGIYHLILVDGSNAPNALPFNNLKFSQPIQYLYPRVNRDNPVSDPHESKSYALPNPIGQVVVNDPENSLTKESLNNILDDLNVGIGITNIVSNPVGTSHTIYTSTDHGLNRITGVSLVTVGQGYGTGTAGTLYNARLVGIGTSVVGDGATAVISIDSGGSITDIKIMDGGSAYGIGNSLSVVGLATTTGYVAGIVSVTSIYDNTNTTFELNSIDPSQNGYNTLYRITGISTGNSKEIQVSSASSISSPSTVGLGISYTTNASLITTGEIVTISSITYTNTTGIATITSSVSHGLQVDNKVLISGSNNSFFNSNFIVKKVNSLTSFEINCGISTISQSSSGTVYAYYNGFNSRGGTINKNNENISGRLVNNYDNITTTLLGPVTSPTLDNITITNPTTLGLNVGDYLQIGNEIVRVKTTVTGNPVYVFRGVLGTRSTAHTAGVVVRRISPKPIEFRRNSIIRASGHTFEYVGFGPGNYSTALPDKQDRKLSASEELLSQSTKINGGLTVFTGMNDAGDFYIGNKKVSSATGQEEVFDTPVPSVTGEELDIGGVSVGFDVITPLEVSISRSINVEGGNDNTIISRFNGPVIFNNKITSTSTKGIEANSIYLQGDANISRKYTVGISTPTVPGNAGDVVYNSEPISGDALGWVYTNNNIWEKFGKISTNGFLPDGIIDVYTYGNLQGSADTINFVGTGGIDVLSQFDALTGVSTLTFRATITDPATLNVAGVSTFNGSAIFNDPVTFNDNIFVSSGIITATNINTTNLTYTNLIGPSIGIATFTAANSNFSGNIILGTTTKSSDTFVRVLAGDNNKAGFEAYGNAQGTGYLYVGEDINDGGGIFYNGNGTPAFATGETADTIAFYRKSGGTNEVVFSYPSNSNSVSFKGTVSAPNFTTPGGLNVVGVITCSDLNSTSDENLKYGIRKIENSIDILNSISGVNFKWKSNDKPSIGVIAQEVERELPELVSNNGENKTVNYNGLIAVLIEAVKQQQTQINKLEEKIKTLEDR